MAVRIGDYTVKAKFTVLGEPQGKGRPRFVRKTGMTFTPDKTVSYENLIATEYRRQVGTQFTEGTLDMRIMAYFGIPKSASKRKKQQMESGELRPAKKPDMDNIMKVVADALNAVAYRDDAQVVDSQIRKFYSHNPRIEVIIQSAQK